MKVSFLVYNIYGIGGTVKTVVNTANFLAKNGYDVEIISVRKTRGRPTFDIEDNIKLTPLFNIAGGVNTGSFLKRLIGKVTNRLPSFEIDKEDDLYHMFSLYTDILIKNKLKNLKTDVLITTRDSFNMMSNKYVSSDIVKIGEEHAQLDVKSDRLRKKLLKNYKRLNYFRVLSEVEFENYSEFLEDTPVEVILITNFIPAARDLSTLSEKVLVTGGRIVEQKKFSRLVDMSREIFDKHPDWELRIYGEGDERKKVIEKIKEYSLQDNVFLYPPTIDMQGEFSKGSIFVLPSSQESFGMVLVEAMTTKIPVVSFETYGANKIMTDVLEDFKVPQEDSSGFTQKALDLIESEQLREKIAERGYEISKFYSEDNIGQEWIKLLTRIKDQEKNKPSRQSIKSK